MHNWSAPLGIVAVVPFGMDSEPKHLIESGRRSPDRRGSADGIMATFDDMKERSPNDPKKKVVMAQPQVGVSCLPKDDEMLNARRRRALRTALNSWSGCSKYPVPLHLASTCNDFAALGRAFDRWQAHAGGDTYLSPKTIQWTPELQGATPPTRTSASVVPRRRVTPTRQRPASKAKSRTVYTSHPTPDRSVDVSDAIDVRDIFDVPLTPGRASARAMLARAGPPSCLRQDWPSRTPAQPLRRDAPYQDWQRALARNRTANTIGRAKDWAYRSAVLSDVKHGTPSKIQPWHVDDGSYSYRNIVAATAMLNARARETLATPAGDDDLGHVLAGSLVTERSITSTPWR